MSTFVFSSFRMFSAVIYIYIYKDHPVCFLMNKMKNIFVQETSALVPYLRVCVVTRFLAQS